MPRAYPSEVRRLIATAFPGMGDNDQVNSDYAGVLSAILTLSREIPSEVLTLSGSDYSRYHLALGAIEQSLVRWHSHPDKVMVRTVHGNPLKLLSDVLSKCADEAPSPTTAGLHFIDDDDLRESIRGDISAAHRDLINGEWKGATVLAGAAIEALLLWALKSKSKAVADAHAARRITGIPRNMDLESQEWNLAHYIEVALELKLIKDETATEARLAKDFRNLIHPGRSQRLGQRCDAGTAHVAIGAIEHVARDLAECLRAGARDG